MSDLNCPRCEEDFDGDPDSEQGDLCPDCSDREFERESEREARYRESGLLPGEVVRS